MKEALFNLNRLFMKPKSVLYKKIKPLYYIKQTYRIYSKSILAINLGVMLKMESDTRTLEISLGLIKTLDNNISILLELVFPGLVSKRYLHNLGF